MVDAEQGRWREQGDGATRRPERWSKSVGRGATGTRQSVARDAGRDIVRLSVSRPEPRLRLRKVGTTFSVFKFE